MTDQTSVNAFPSLNPANNDSLLGVFNTVLKKFLQGQINDMLPASVVAFDRTSNMVSVQPMIMIVSTEDQQVSRAVINNIPVLQMGGGGFILNFPLNPGDLGWIKSNDRDIALYMQGIANPQQVPPNSGRLHSFSDAIFIPSVLSNFTIADEDSGNVVLQNLAGTVKMSVSNTGFKFTGDITVDGNMTVTGNVTGNGISLDTHVHGGVQTGTGDTGVPI